MLFLWVSRASHPLLRHALAPPARLRLPEIRARPQRNSRRGPGAAVRSRVLVPFFPSLSRPAPFSGAWNRLTLNTSLNARANVSAQGSCDSMCVLYKTKRKSLRGLQNCDFPTEFWQLVRLVKQLLVERQHFGRSVEGVVHVKEGAGGHVDPDLTGKGRGWWKSVRSGPIRYYGQNGCPFPHY